MQIPNTALYIWTTFKTSSDYRNMKAEQWAESERAPIIWTGGKAFDGEGRGGAKLWSEEEQKIAHISVSLTALQSLYQAGESECPEGSSSSQSGGFEVMTCQYFSHPITTRHPVMFLPCFHMPLDLKESFAGSRCERSPAQHHSECHFPSH